MVKQLRRKLVGAYVLATGLLLSLIVTGLLLLSLNQYETNNISRYQTVFGNVVDTIRDSNKISHMWLAQSEISENMMISVSSNSVPLSFKGAWKPLTDRDRLFEKLNHFAEQDGFFEEIPGSKPGEVRSPVYSIYGDQREHYYGSIYLKKAYGTEQKILILKALTDEKEVYRNSVLLYFSVNLMGLVILFFICRTFGNHSLKPLETGLKRQSEFIAAASHELRAPLTVIRAGIHAVSMDEGKAKQFLPGIEKEGERMTVLIDDLLQLASADAGTWTMRAEPLMTDTFLISNYDALAELCRKKNQPFELRLQEEELPEVCGDRQRLMQLMTILTDNASSYSPEGSTIAVIVRSDAKHVFIEVEDHGCGISEEDKKRVFDRFYRADKSRNDKSHYGLGLSIAVELVKLHHGKLTVKDTDGGGSTFVLQLPVWDSQRDGDVGSRKKEKGIR